MNRISFNSTACVPFLRHSVQNVRNADEPFVLFIYDWNCIQCLYCSSGLFPYLAERKWRILGITKHRVKLICCFYKWLSFWWNFMVEISNGWKRWNRKTVRLTFSLKSRAFNVNNKAISWVRASSLQSLQCVQFSNIHYRKLHNLQQKCSQKIRTICSSVTRFRNMHWQ